MNAIRYKSFSTHNTHFFHSLNLVNENREKSISIFDHSWILTSIMKQIYTISMFVSCMTRIRIRIHSMQTTNNCSRNYINSILLLITFLFRIRFSWFSTMITNKKFLLCQHLMKSTHSQCQSITKKHICELIHAFDQCMIRLKRIKRFVTSIHRIKNDIQNFRISKFSVKW